ncbi:hypothetical protein F7725_004618 [Dissostichus mawsoni]|uniref:TERF1-interacting nuclear factor 2 N-terminal domain-containing protein n=1 Tax=Dissostichus mawsoni TaxID=36200 RepID=A0A7J5XJB0_DISMA|nr:hypothetical protein F7725_004618 [Dissostichus mawsoni]
MTARKTKGNDAILPFAALQLLAPPVRLVSAALWKVMEQRDVMHYGVVEEFVTSACETVPGLLTVRHQGKLALGLRARLIMELCSTQPDKKEIMSHLERIRAPAALSTSSATKKRDLKIMNTVEGFQSLVHSLLTDTTRRKHFFKEEFPVDYGPKFDQELEKLLWEFLIRLDQFFPVPNLAQVACARAASQPQLLQTLLQHQTCLGHLETADSILSSLYLPPSGKVPSDPPTGATNSFYQSYNTQTRDKTPFIKPVMGLIFNEDVPFMIRTQRGEEQAKHATNEHWNPKKNLKFTAIKQKLKDDGTIKGEEQVEEERKESNGMKRKQPDMMESDSDEEEEEEEEEEEILGVTISGKKRIKHTTSERVDDRAALKTCMMQLGVKKLPEDPSLCSLFVSCLRRQPKVILHKLSVTAASPTRTKSSSVKQQNQKRKSPVQTPTRKLNQTQKPGSERPGLDDKENHPVLPGVIGSPSQQRTNSGTSARPGDTDDYVADSEDEATKNFKVRRYYKTKHGTYVPTLREYWKPGMTRRDLSSAVGKNRR